MGFKREASRDPMPTYEVLTARMVGIGLNFDAEPEVDADIESTLVFGSVAGMEQASLRTLSVLTTWLGVHHAHVNADRLTRVVAEQPSMRVRAYWSGAARWLKRDRRFARLERLYSGPRVDVLEVGTDFQIKRCGEDERFAGSKLRAPRGILRDRATDVLTPAVLVKRHMGYRNRVLMGPSFRADVWTVLERSPDLSVADIARGAACSFATAWQTAQDFKLLRNAETMTPRSSP